MNVNWAPVLPRVLTSVTLVPNLPPTSRVTLLVLVGSPFVARLRQLLVKLCSLPSPLELHDPGTVMFTSLAPPRPARHPIILACGIWSLLSIRRTCLVLHRRYRYVKALVNGYLHGIFLKRRITS